MSVSFYELSGMGIVSSVRRRVVREPEFLLSDILSDDEITIFPESSAVLDGGSVTMPLTGTTADNRETVFYGEGNEDGQSLLYLAWRRAENVVYFGLSVVCFTLIALGVYFLYVFISGKRDVGKNDRFGVKWTRLREG